MRGEHGGVACLGREVDTDLQLAASQRGKLLGRCRLRRLAHVVLLPVALQSLLFLIEVKPECSSGSQARQLQIRAMTIAPLAAGIHAPRLCIRTVRTKKTAR